MSEARVKAIALSGEDGWSIWPWAILRAPGFSARGVVELKAVAAARAADDLHDVTRRADEARDAVRRGLVEASRSSPDSRQLVRRMLRRVRKSRVPAVDFDALKQLVPADAIARWTAALRDVEQARARFAQTFTQDSRAARARLHALAADPRLREAVTWQNHRARATMLDRVANAPVDRNDRFDRRAEIRVASYLQRYCVKNDTIGFFGPVCWATLTADGPPLVHRADDALLATREVFVEDWAVRALGREIDKIPGLRPWLRPRRTPAVGVLGTRAYALMSPPVDLTEDEARVLSLCDGRRRARDVAAELAAGSAISQEEVFAILDRLCKRGLAIWRVETVMSMRALALLRELLGGVEDDELRARALAPVDALDRARGEVASADGADELQRALEQLDRSFEAITGQPSTRNPGRMYAARTLVFMDGQRADSVRVGPGIYQRLTPVLTILVHAARWFTHEMAALYRVALRELYEAAAARLRDREVPVLHIWLAAQALFPLAGGSPAPMARLVPRLRERWTSLFGLDALAPGTTRLDCRSSDLTARARELFPAPGPGWALARHHSPDIMIAARDAAAVDRGEFQLVMGEFHCAWNTAIASCVLAQHPRVQDMYALWESAFPEPCVLPGPPRDLFTCRVNQELATAKDYRLDWAPDIAGPQNARAMAVGDMVIVEQDGAMLVRSRDRSLELDLLEFFGQALSSLCPLHFELPSRGRHTPRITIDDVVVQRETWRVPISEIGFWRADTAMERFRLARQWRRELMLPQECFMRPPAEPKPLYVDFESPAYVELLARSCRVTARAGADGSIGISEMLPAHDQLWMTDKSGQPYTSELRFVVIDPAAPAPSGTRRGLAQPQP